MNFCTNCGSKINEKNKFCTKCGAKVVSKQELKRKEEKKTQNIILLLGIFLVLFSTFALGIISWNNMNHILRLSFFGFECVLFFGLSYIIKKLTENKIYRVFFVVGLILIPYTLSLIPYYGLLNDYFNKGPGLYIYLAVIYFITFVIYLLINAKFKSKFVNLIALFSLLLSFCSTALIFSKDIITIALLVTAYLFIINILSNLKVFNDDMRMTMKILTYILFIIDFIILWSSFMKESLLLNNILNAVSLLLYLGTGYIFIYNNRETTYKAILPFIFELLVITYLANALTNYDVIAIYSIALVTLILYFISLVFNNKILSAFTLGISYFVMIILMLLCIGFNYNSVLLIISIITLLFNIFNVLGSKYKFINFAIPFNIFVIIFSISRLTFNFKMIYLLITTSLVFLIIYVILKVLKNKYALTYLLTSLGLGILSMYNFGYAFDKIEYINYGIILVIFLVFALSKYFKENSAISIISFIFLNIATIGIFSNLKDCLYYALLTMSGLTLILCLLLSKLKKLDLKPYILYSEIVIFIVTLFNHMHFSSYILFINVFIYALSYMAVTKFHNKKWWRLAYIMLGLLTIIRVINTIIEPIVIASIISMVAILVIITIMYLLELENNVSLTLLSLVILYPYYNLIGNTFADIMELYVLPVIIYIIVFTEIIKFKDEENRKVWTIIPLSLISYFFVVTGSGVASIIIDVILALLFILLGLYRKYNYLIYFGIIFLVVTIFIRLFTVLDSIAVVIILIIIGFILIGAALFNELRKKK